jgi:hypothetical protein
MGLASSSSSKNPRLPGPRFPENSFFSHALIGVTSARRDAFDATAGFSLSLFLPFHS